MIQRTVAYANTNAPTSQTVVYTASAQFHIDAATAVNDTGSAIALTIESNSVPIFSGDIPANTTLVLAGCLNQVVTKGNTLQVTAGAANLNLTISGRDF